MVMKWSMAGILSILFTPVFYLVVLRFVGQSADPLDTIFWLGVAQLISFTFSLFLTIALNWKARSPYR